MINHSLKQRCLNIAKISINWFLFDTYFWTSNLKGAKTDVSFVKYLKIYEFVFKMETDIKSWP